MTDRRVLVNHPAPSGVVVTVTLPATSSVHCRFADGSAPLEVTQWLPDLIAVGMAASALTAAGRSGAPADPVEMAWLTVDGCDLSDLVVLVGDQRLGRGEVLDAEQAMVLAALGVAETITDGVVEAATHPDDTVPPLGT